MNSTPGTEADALQATKRVAAWLLQGASVFGQEARAVLSDAPQRMGTVRYEGGLTGLSHWVEDVLYGGRYGGIGHCLDAAAKAQVEEVCAGFDRDAFDGIDWAAVARVLVPPDDAHLRAWSAELEAGAAETESEADPDNLELADYADTAYEEAFWAQQALPVEERYPADRFSSTRGDQR